MGKLSPFDIPILIVVALTAAVTVGAYLVNGTADWVLLAVMLIIGLPSLARVRSRWAAGRA